MNERRRKKPIKIYRINYIRNDHKLARFCIVKYTIMDLIDSNRIKWKCIHMACIIIHMAVALLIIIIIVRTVWDAYTRGFVGIYRKIQREGERDREKTQINDRSNFKPNQSNSIRCKVIYFNNRIS